MHYEGVDLSLFTKKKLTNTEFLSFLKRLEFEILGVFFEKLI